MTFQAKLDSFSLPAISLVAFYCLQKKKKKRPTEVNFFKISFDLIKWL